LEVAGGEALANVFGEDFAEFDAPLVEAVDAPDGAADEDTVFVQGDERAQAGGVEPVQQQEGAGAVAWEVAVTACIGFALQERLGLRQSIGQ
jgi:hypothetical protein